MTAYARPRHLDEALALMAGGGRLALAGATDLWPGRGARLGAPVVDLSAVAALQGITRSDQGLRIGAAVTWAEIATAPLPPALAGLQAAARQVGGRQVQNAGTIGGNLCNASPAADGLPPLLVLDAEAEIAGPEGCRRLPLSAFVTGPRRTALQPAELLVALHLPAAALQGQSGFLKLGARAHLVISIASVAARLQVEGGRITAAALAVGACSPVARRLPAAEAALIGQPAAAARPDPAPFAALVAAALDPIDDIRATAAYRRVAAAELAGRVVASVLAAVRKGGAP